MLKRILIAAAVVLLGAGGYFAWMLRPQVDDIPETLEEIDQEVDPLALTFKAQGPLPALTLRDLSGQTAFFLIQGKESMQSGEGKDLARALNRWALPEDVAGYWIGDAEGFGLLAAKIEEEFVGPMRAENKFPLYVDFEGELLRTYKLPKGHVGLLVLGPEGDVVFRHSGAADADELAELKALLRAEEPPPTPEAPEFELGELKREACAEKPCLLAFLSKKVARTEVPRIDGGFDGDMAEMMERFKDPDLRLIQMLLAGWKVENIHVGVVGPTEDLDIESWTQAESAPELREAFGVGEEQSGIVVVKAGKTAFHALDLVPLWKLGLAQDVLGVESVDFEEEDED